MNTRQLKYAIELSQTLNFSQVAEKLGISQPALSKQILSLEEEVGTKLFDRTTNPMKLTAAGEYFFCNAKNILFQQEKLVRSMEEFKNGIRGKLTIGITPFRSIYLLPGFIKKIRERYPEVEICIKDIITESIRKEVEDGTLDFGVVNLPVDEKIFEYISMEPDVLVLVVPVQMQNLIDNLPQKQLDEISFKDCSKLPFVVGNSTREMRSLFDRLCAKADFKPEIAMEVVGITTAWTMAQAGIGATIVPLQFIGGAIPAQDTVMLFKIKDNTYSRQPAIITRRGKYLPEYAKYAISLLSKKEDNA